MVVAVDKQVVVNILYFCYQVIFSTGYVLNYPFMEDKLRIHGKTLFYQDNLYKV